MFNLSKGGILNKPEKDQIQLKNIKVENFPVHTMKKDLELAKNPSQPAAAESSTPEPAPLPPFSQNDKLAKFMGKDPEPAKQTTSPFLSQENKKVVPEKIKETTVDLASSATLSITSKPTSHIWTRVITIAVVIFAALAAGFGGYYFWITRETPSTPSAPTTTPPVSETPSQPTNSDPTAPSTPAQSASSISTDKPNYLSIDIDNTDSTQIKSTLDQHAREVSSLNATTPIEFILTDKENNPLNFDQFAKKADIALPADIMSNLSNSFSLFMYNDNGKINIGLAIDSKDITGEKLKSGLQKSESSLVTSLNPLYISSKPSTDGKPFNTSYYGGAEIRYLNLVSTDGLSLDYTIFRDRLLIGTSKMTLRSIIDYETSISAVKGAEDVQEYIIDDIKGDVMKKNTAE